MKTFRFTLVALVATALFTACTNEEAVSLIKGDAQEISFRLQGGTPEITTRAMATTLDNIEAFVVYGTDNVMTSPALILDGVTVARQFDGTFAYAPQAYYNQGAANASFFAFSPVSANLTSAVTIPSTFLTTGASFSYEVLPPDGTGDAVQEDLLVTGTNVTTLTAPVNLTFKHALSRIFVTATNDAADPVIISDLKLLNLSTTGALAVNLTPTLTWTPTTTKDDYAYILAPSGVVVSGGTAIKTLVTSMEQGMMILPQTITTTGTGDYTVGDFALEITYEFANFGSQTRYVYIPTGYAFLPGNQYNINIAFDGLQPIKFIVIAVDPFGTPVTVN